MKRSVHEGIVCPKCGKGMDNSMRYCNQCGGSLSSVSRPLTGQEKKLEEHFQRLFGKKGKSWTCRDIAHSIQYKNGAKFCAGCGKELRELVAKRK